MTSSVETTKATSTPSSRRKKRGLGRGLDALLQAGKSEPIQAVDNVEVTDNSLRHLPVEYLKPGQYQPRKDMDRQSLEELSESIKRQGIMQPIVVRPLPTQGYEIIAGERRWRAAQLAGLAEVPTLVREVPDEAAIAMALIENLQREDLHPIEEAQALQRLQLEFELTQQEVAEAVGKSRVAVTHLLRLLKLEASVKTLLENGDIEFGHAKVLLGLEGQDQIQAAERVVAKGLNVRQTEALVKNWINYKQEKGKSKPDPNIQRLETVLGDRLGASVAIQHAASGRGKLVIKYNSLDELDGILDHIK